MSLSRLFSLLALTVVFTPAAFGQTASSPATGALPATPVPHVLGLTGAPNFRDLGGYETSDGRHVRFGLVFRSNKLSSLTPADETTIASLHIVSEIDLRTREERTSEPSLWLRRPADLYESPKLTLRPIIGPLIGQIHDGASARKAFADFYAKMPDMYAQEYRALFLDLLAGETPMVIHCTAGKDRTGVAAAILLTALGVPRETVVADYTLTEKLLPPPAKPAPGATPKPGASKALAAFAKLPKDAQIEMWRSEPVYIDAALDSIDHEYGSVDGYLKKALGLNDAQIAELRTNLTQ